MTKYINAEYIFETLQEHQQILKRLQPDQVQDKVYDDVIIMSDAETAGVVSTQRLELTEGVNAVTK